MAATRDVASVHYAISGGSSLIVGGGASRVGESVLAPSGHRHAR